MIGPRLSLFTWLHLAVPPEWIRVPVLLLLALLFVRWFAGLDWSDIGLAPWKTWSAVEKSYFIQVVVLANMIFLVVFRHRIGAIVTGPGIAERVATTLVPTLLWGFYQELMYRGLLQTELTRRWGTVRGILVSNIAFTFGPLHFYHFARSSAPIAMFASIFVMGLFFGVLFERSHNLWMVGVFHGIGNAYVD